MVRSCLTNTHFPPPLPLKCKSTPDPPHVDLTVLTAPKLWCAMSQLSHQAREWVAQKKRHVYATQQLELACRRTCADLEGKETSARLQVERVSGPGLWRQGGGTCLRRALPWP